jgi:hypothetical protein
MRAGLACSLAACANTLRTPTEELQLFSTEMCEAHAAAGLPDWLLSRLGGRRVGQHCLRANDAHIALNGDVGAEGLRHMLQPLQRFLGYRSLC